jgi:hypothetical protein
MGVIFTFGRNSFVLHCSSISSLSRNKRFSKITVKLRTLLSLTLPKLLSEERIIKALPITGRCLAFENGILDIACNQLELISTIEKIHLERLKEDRNICAHPTFSIDGSHFHLWPKQLCLTLFNHLYQEINVLARLRSNCVRYYL